MDTIELIKKDLQNKKDMFGRPKIDTVVVLKKDDKGYYIEYAFKNGAPHDNRCLSWYDSYQEEAYIRNGWVEGLSEEDARKRLDEIRKNRESRVGKVFYLSSCSCGYEENSNAFNASRKESWEKYHPNEEYIPEDHICSPGHPSKYCLLRGICSKHWTYESPIKCACWSLNDGKTMDEYIREYKIFMPASELTELMNKE